MQWRQTISLLFGDTRPPQPGLLPHNGCSLADSSKAADLMSVHFWVSEQHAMLPL